MSVTGFFNKSKPLIAPPVSTPKREPRELWTTEAYKLQAHVPQSEPVSMGVRGGEENYFSTWGAHAHMVTTYGIDPNTGRMSAKQTVTYLGVAGE